MFRIDGTMCTGEPEDRASKTVWVGSSRVASSCAKYSLTT